MADKKMLGSSKMLRESFRYKPMPKNAVRPSKRAKPVREKTKTTS